MTPEQHQTRARYLALLDRHEQRTLLSARESSGVGLAGVVLAGVAAVLVGVSLIGGMP